MTHLGAYPRMRVLAGPNGSRGRSPFNSTGMFGSLEGERPREPEFFDGHLGHRRHNRETGIASFRDALAAVTSGLWQKKARINFLLSPRSVFSLLTMLLLSMLLAAQRMPGATSAPKAPDILLVSIDTLRADHVGCYGHPLNTTPTIDRLAREGIRFTRAISQSSWTLPVHASMLTGLYPIQHGCTYLRAPSLAYLAPKVVTLADTLREQGYTTLAVTSCEFVSPAYGLDQGFDVFNYQPTNAQARVDAALRLLEAHDARPYFLFLHLFDPHDPYCPPPPYREMFVPPGEADDVTGRVNHKLGRPADMVPDERTLDVLRRLYDAEIRYVDDQLARIVSRLEARGTLDDTIVVVTSDHGESFGENGVMFHGTSIGNPEVHVPLIVRYPRRIAAGSEETAVVEASVPIKATLLHLAGVGAASRHEGRLPLPSDGSPGAGPAHSETVLPAVPLFGAQDDAWKVVAAMDCGTVEPARACLYRAEDWLGAEDVSSAHRDVVERYVGTHIRRYLDLRWTTSANKEFERRLGPAEEERLRSMGYAR